MQSSRGFRRGLNFTVRLTEQERAALDAARAGTAGPGGLGPWLVWRALEGAAGVALPELGQCQLEAADGHCHAGDIVLDLCGGSGAWSEPYRAAGYDVRLVTLPENDVRTYVPPDGVHGILAAPPCTEFSIAKNGKVRDFVKGMEIVNACLRIVLMTRPAWWAVENPGSGLLGRFLGIPRFGFQPYEFGDPWSKRTALWGAFALPARGPFVRARGSAMQRATVAARSVTPPGFAKAFFAANP